MSDLPLHRTMQGDEIDRLQAENEALRARVAELEQGLSGIANCAYGYSHPKAQTADEAASWMNGEGMRLLGDPQPSAWLLRKQAEKLEEIATLVKQANAEGLSTVESIYEGLVLNSNSLRQQADEIEKAGGEK